LLKGNRGRGELMKKKGSTESTTNKVDDLS